MKRRKSKDICCASLEIYAVHRVKIFRCLQLRLIHNEFPLAGSFCGKINLLQGTAVLNASAYVQHTVCSKMAYQGSLKRLAA